MFDFMKIKSAYNHCICGHAMQDHEFGENTRIAHYYIVGACKAKSCFSIFCDTGETCGCKKYEAQ